MRILKIQILKRQFYEENVLIYFFETLGVKQAKSILDVGGTEAIWTGTGLEKIVTLLNINFAHKRHADFTYIVGDACNMEMFGENEFDIIFSNSVIEHVGNFERQKLFAKEIQRVGKKYWIQTPFKHFPIEPHFVFPLFQYLPYPLQKYIGLNWKLSHFKMSNSTNEQILDELNRLRLLNEKEMSAIFNDANIIKEKYLGMVKSLIAIKN